MAKPEFQQIDKQELIDIFEPDEGSINFYYGRIGQGKTYAATADIIELLKRGEIVYANWRINFSDFDERSSFKIALVKYFAGKKYFFAYNHENFHYIDTNEPDLIGILNKLVGVHIFIDEGQWIFNSHLKTDDPDKRRLILEGGHYCRSLNVITQRPMNILKDIRSQINIWYKCEKRLSIFGLTLFARWEYQDMKDDVPDEDPELQPPVKHYWAREEIFRAYETHAMRRDDAIYVEPVFQVFETTYFERLALVYSFLIPGFVKRVTRHLYASLRADHGYLYAKVTKILRLDKHNIIPKTKDKPIPAFNLKDLKNKK